MRKQINLRFYQDLLTHPVLVAIPILLLFYVLLPDVFKKYTIKSINSKVNNSIAKIYYNDLNNDGTSEKLTFSPELQKGSSLTIYFSGNAYGQWNFEGKLIGDPFFLIGDYDNDEHKEVTVFTIKGDSLLLHMVDYKQKKRYLLQNFLLARVIITPKGDYDFILNPIRFEDLNGDRKQELLYMLAAGYSRFPRKLFALNIDTRRISSSPDLGGYAVHFDFADINHDRLPEITYTNYAPGNGKDSSSYLHDSSSYVAVLDNNLRFIFKPLELKGVYSSCSNLFIGDNGIYSIVSFCNPGANNPEKKSLKIFDLKGKLVNQLIINNGEAVLTGFEKTVVQGKSAIILAHKFLEIQAFDLHLKPVQISDIICGENALQAFDFDCDGEKEFLIKGVAPDEWFICRSDFKHLGKFNATQSFESPDISSVLHKGNLPSFSLRFGSREFIYQYGKNPQYYLKYPFFTGIYIFIIIILLFFRFMLRLQFQRRYEADKRMLELKIAALHNQIDSHFTFNVLNTIGSAILQEQKNKAYDLLNKFSRMLRKNITETNRTTRTLESEIEYVTDFLDLQQNRFSNLFEYTIDIEDGINLQLSVPKGCIQVHTENAVKHGILPLKTGGKLKISIREVAGYIHLNVTDNGVGRAVSANNNKNSTHQGYRIMHSYYELLNSKNALPIKEVIEDLFNETGNPAGTSITVSIPVKGGDAFHSNLTLNDRHHEN